MRIMPGILLSCLFVSLSAYSSQDIATNYNYFQLKLNSSRIIYHPDSKGVSITVSNQQGYPMLVRPTILSGDKKSILKSYIATPTLFKIDEKQNSKIRLTQIDKSENKPNQETLNWLCVLGVPPSDDSDEWNETHKKNSPIIDFKINVKTCIKIFNRPNVLRGTSEEAASSLIWSKKDGKLIVDNPTGYYINFNSISIDGHNIKKSGYIEPFSKKEFNLPKDITVNKILWSVITDIGGISSSKVTNL